MSTKRWKDGHSDLLKQQQQLACDCNGYNFKCLTSKLLVRARVVFASLNAALINFPADPVLWIRVFWAGPDTAYQEKLIKLQFFKWLFKNYLLNNKDDFYYVLS